MQITSNIGIENMGFPKKYALDFDGVDDYVEVLGVNDPELATNLTLRITVFFNLNDERNNMINKSTTGEQAQFCLDGINGNYRFFGYMDGSPIGILSNAPQVVLKKWLTITGTFDGTYWKLYINDELVETKNEPGTLDVSDKEVLIGERVNFSKTVNALISELSIWKRAISHSEVIEYNSRDLKGNEDGLISYYKFNEGAGTTLFDNAGNNDGNIIGPLWKEV